MWQGRTLVQPLPQPSAIHQAVPILSATWPLEVTVPQCGLVLCAMHAIEVQIHQHRHLKLFLPSSSLAWRRTNVIQGLPPTPTEFRVMLHPVQVVGKPITFLVHTGATFSVLTAHSSPMVPLPVSVMGVGGTPPFHPRLRHVPVFLQDCFSHSIFFRSCPSVQCLFGAEISSAVWSHPLSNPHNLS